jgi:signal transduction histidine kinase
LLWLNLLRLIVLSSLLVLTGYPISLENFGVGTATSRLALAALALSFAGTGVILVFLRKGRYSESLALAQLVLDQLTWTVFVYLTGGVGSAATLFYGLTCLAGAITAGVRGAWVAAVAAVLSYGALAVSVSLRWISGPSDQNPAFFTTRVEDIQYHFGVNVLGIVVVALLAAYLAERLRLAGGKLAEAEERALRAERLAVLGRLSSGLAHEIRNPLGSISGCIQLLATNRQLSAEDRQLCLIIQRETARLNDLVSDMMDLTRGRKPERGPVDVVATANDVVALASGSGRAVSDVQVRYTGLATRTLVSADPAQLRQLIWNLVRNAVQASSPGDAVDVRVTESEGKEIDLSVVDCGPGIDDEAMRRLFDPFFTTRSHGTGIGLAVVKRIADEHGYSIVASSEKGKGAEFTVKLGRRLDLGE